MRKTLFDIRTLATLGTLWGSLLLAPLAGAEDNEATDPPARVGSISELRGPVDVSFENGAAWDRARPNQPVTTQTSLWAPPGSQAEVRIGSSSVRLDGNTQAVFSQLDDHGIAIDVAQGTVRARVRNLATGDSFSLAADGVRAEAQAPGDYRVSYDPDRRAYTVRTLAGRLRVVTPTNSFNLERGQESIVEQGGGNVQLRGLGERDDFDLWAESRDAEQDRLASTRYVSPETTGVEALDRNGSWQNDPGYGAVWYPYSVRSGWAPYRYGRWANVRPWGWTWVDDAPWGFAPFHYGRWALFGSRWGWVPGPLVARPIWAPALVGYVGGGSGGFSLNIGIGAPIGWFPLGPHEYYQPPYRYSPRYIQQVNITNVIQVDGSNSGRTGKRWREREPDRSDYRYARRPEALTVVSEDNFRNARSIGRDHVQLTPQQAAQLQPVTATMPERGGAPRPGGVRGGMPIALLPTPAPAALRADEPGRPPRQQPQVNQPRSRDEGPRASQLQRGNDDDRPGFDRSGPRAAPERRQAPAVMPGSPVPIQLPPPVRAETPTPPSMTRPERPVKDERSDRSDRGDRADRWDRSDRGDSVARTPRESAPPVPPRPAAVPQAQPQFAAPQPAQRPLPQAMPEPRPAPRLMPEPVARPAPQAQQPPQQPRMREPAGERGDKGGRGGGDDDTPRGRPGQRER